MPVTVTGLTAARMLEIEAACIVDAHIDGSGHLILIQHDGTELDQGVVIGAAGAPGAAGSPGAAGAPGAAGSPGAAGADMLERTINTQAGSYTAVLADANKVIQSTSATAVNVTIPPQTSVTWPTPSVLSGVQYGAGQVTIVPGSGVTLRSSPGLKVANQYGVWEARRIASDEWLVYGRLAP